MNWSQVEAWLQRDNRAVLPLGTTEQHAGQSLSVDSILSHTRKIPAQRYGTVAEVSAAIVFLLSPAAAFITGSCIRIDGGGPNARSSWNLQPHRHGEPFDGFHLDSLPDLLKRAR